ncbi:protein ergS [Aspergillus ibericus CBS 121593]|uniref:Phosphatidylglycerol lysyltransferase C-terminal domain-containing protein n=1 Tax=Aspergillus ibericus CBS 121593 TaxID=1448316 RepID=A0A395H8I3_9EURO|nr:hypothetical protein BO80DRAFT_273400 [Aspergillus ibericus CBS 121593]RAL03879.1 hypothetical protein BO80DRAFT_273400 [Aspergillus ibericus CBS 121593]
MLCTDMNPDPPSKSCKQQPKQDPKRKSKPNSKVLLADTIGQALYERLQARLDGPVSIHHPLAPWPSVHSSSSIHSTSTRTLSPATSTSDIKSIVSSRTSHDSMPKPPLPPPLPNRIITLAGPNTSLEALSTITRLAAQHSQVSHMGLLDPSYSIFLHTTHTAALCFKILHKTAIISGDPISHPSDISALLSEFHTYRKAHHLGIAFLGASPILTHYADATVQPWTLLHFGKERVLNPTTNPILHETTGKRILLQTKQLLHPTKGNLTLDIYIPTTPKKDLDITLETSLQSIYNTWRTTRNASTTPQAFITSYNLFPTTPLMTYIYARAPTGEPIAFAALRYLGAKTGYHIDPCIAAPTAPKGTTDLLLFAAMALCKTAGVSYLSIGYEPFEELGEVSGLPSALEHVTRKMYRFAFGRLPLAGKKAYHDKWRPEEELEEPLYLVFPGGGVPEIRAVVAVMHVANVRIRRVVWG